MERMKPMEGEIRGPDLPRGDERQGWIGKAYRPGRDKEFGGQGRMPLRFYRERETSRARQF